MNRFTGHGEGVLRVRRQMDRIERIQMIEQGTLGAVGGRRKSVIRLWIVCRFQRAVEERLPDATVDIMNQGVRTSVAVARGLSNVERGADPE